MGAAIIVLVIFGAAILYAYLNIQPYYANAKALRVYNQMVLFVCFLLCSAWVLRARSMVMGTSDEKYWLPLSLGGSLAIEIIFLLIFFLLRNFWIFKPPRRPGGGSFGF